MSDNHNNMPLRQKVLCQRTFTNNYIVFIFIIQVNWLQCLREAVIRWEKHEHGLGRTGNIRDESTTSTGTFIWSGKRLPDRIQCHCVFIRRIAGIPKSKTGLWYHNHVYTGHHYSRHGLWSHPGSHQSPFKATYRDRHWSAIPDYHTSLSIFRSGPFFGVSDDPCRRDAGNGGVSVWDDVECFLLLGGRRCVAQVS